MGRTDTLNVVTSDLTGSKKPVMVYIHGGSYISGGSSEPFYNGEKLVSKNKDIIYVSLNYRLGALGSMNLSSLDKEGKYKNSINLNILDQMQALKWINQNIAAFGGDPGNVTLFGQSSGGYSISTLMTNNEATQYFQKAIAQSTVLDSVSMKTMKESKIIGDAFIELTGVQTMKELLKLSTDEILQYQMEIFNDPRYSLAYEPVQDGVTVPLNAFEKIQNGSAKEINLMIGSKQGEFDQTTLEASEKEVHEMAIGVYPGIDEKLVDLCPNNYKERLKKESYMDLINDAKIRVPSILFAQAQSKHADTYMYYLSWKPKEAKQRAPHSADIPFIFVF